MKKAVLWVLIILVVLVGGVLLFLNYGANSAIKTALQSQGSAMTETGVTVNDVNLSLLGGSLSLSGIGVKNPAGFTTPNAISLNQIKVAVDRDSLFSDKIVIKEIRVDQPAVTLERGGKKTNLQVLQDAINRHAPPSSSEGAPVKVLINDLYVTATTLNYTLKPGSAVKTIKLPDIHLQNIGTGGEGVDVKTAINQIVAQMSPLVVAELVKLEGVDAVKGAIGKVGNVGDLLQGEGGGAVEDVSKGLGNMFDKLGGK